MPAGIWYTTREAVKTALDEMETARSNDAIDEAIESGARDVDGFCLQPVDGMAPLLATKRFDFPSRAQRSSNRVRFNGPQLISATLVTSAGGTVTISPSDYILEPPNEPPYTSIATDLSVSATFDSGATYQNAIAITGLWGWDNVTRSVGSLSSTLAASTSATASLAWTTARFGVGTVLVIDSERMVITSRSFVDSTQNLGADLAADMTATAVSVSDGTGFAVEEIINVGTERMRVVDIIGNTLTVLRAWDGSQLAAHTTGADVYALTGVELERAVLGTTLAAHSSAAPVSAWRPHGLLAELNRAYAINTLLQGRAGYARVAGTGEFAREFTGRGIAAIEEDVRTVFVPQVRHRGI